jgi:hypothetical protein
VEGFFEAAERDGFEGMTHTQAEWVDGGTGGSRRAAAWWPMRRSDRRNSPGGGNSRRWSRSRAAARSMAKSAWSDATTSARAKPTPAIWDKPRVGTGGIENQRHGSLDVSYGEDQARMRAGHAVENFFASHHPPLDSPRQDAQDRH